MPLKIRERDVEQAVIRFAKSRNCLIYKFSSPSHRGVCDRIVMGPTGVVLFLELKAPGEKPTALQQKFINDIRQQGGNAEWADNIDLARTLIATYCL